MFINRYNIIEKIGEGGMGTVWKVYDEVEKREVALKEIKRKSGEEKLETGSRFGLTTTKTRTTEAELRFSEEFRTMTKLHYPYIVKVLDYGVLENGNKYITMEIVKGDNLKSILEKRRLDFQEIYKVLIQLAQTLNFIHSRYYVHRDIKSDNIILTEDGNIKLMDFGLMDQLGVSSTGALVGTVEYMPPEVPKGGVINESSDLYSLGILGYELVSDERPFKGSNVLEVIRKHIESSPKPLTEIVPDTPLEFERIILKLLEKEQRDRYQTAPELIKDLSKLSKEDIVIETIEQSKSYLFCSELIGREEEINQLKRACEEVKKGKGKSIFIGAHAGVGKSRLLQEFKVEAQISGFLYLEGICIEQGVSLYQSLKEAFKPLIPLTKKKILDKYGYVIVKIIPELEREGYKAAASLEEIAEKVRIFESVVGWIKEISKDNFLIISIEDLHWVDAASLDLLNACIRGLKDSPVMFIGTFRDDEVDENSLIFHTVEEDITRLLKLSLLNKECSLALITAMLGKIELRDEVINHIFEVTGGNPFFITETMRSLIEGGIIRLLHGQWKLPDDISQLRIPASIGETITRRLQLLSKEALYLIQISSAMGRELNLSLLEIISNYEKEELFKAMDDLIERQFIKREEKRYFFTHDRVRETLYEQLEESLKLELHAKIGNILETRNADNIDAVVYILAYHFSRSLEQQKAVKYLILAADNALRTNSFAEATGILEQAQEILKIIEYPDKEWALLQLWNKLLKASATFNPRLCIETSKKIIDKFSSLGNLPRMIKIFKLIFKLINMLPNQLAEKIKDKLGSNEPPNINKLNSKKLHSRFPDYSAIIPLWLLTRAYMAVAYTIAGDCEKSLKISNQLIDDLPDKKSLAITTFLLSQAVASMFLGRFKTWYNNMDIAIGIFEKSSAAQLNRDYWWYYGNCIWVYEFAIAKRGIKFTDRDEKLFEKALSIATNNSFYDIIYWSEYVKNTYQTINGRKREFDSTKEMLMSLLKKIGRPPDLEGAVMINMSQMALECGEFELAEKYANMALQKGTQIGDMLQMIFAKVLLGLVAYERKEVNESIQWIEKAIEEGHKTNCERLIPALYSLGDIYLREADLEKASLFVKEAHNMAVSEELENPYYQIHTYRILGQIAQKMKQYEEAEVNLNKSLQIAQLNNNIIQMGLTKTALADLYITLTRYSVAGQLLQEAEQHFIEIDNDYQLQKVTKLKSYLHDLMLRK